MFYADKVGLADDLRSGGGLSPRARRAMETGAAARAAGARRADVPRARRRADAAETVRMRRPIPLSATRDDGVIYMASPYLPVRTARTASSTCDSRSLGRIRERLTDRLGHWARRSAATARFCAQRDAAGGWRADLRRGAGRVRRLAQAILDRRLSPERPSSFCRATASTMRCWRLRAMYAGVLYAPIAPAYSLQAREFDTLASDLRRDAARPGVCGRGRGVRAARCARCAAARRRARRLSVGARRRCPRRPSAAARAHAGHAGVDDAHARVDRRHRSPRFSSPRDRRAGRRA